MKNLLRSGCVLLPLLFALPQSHAQYGGRTDGHYSPQTRFRIPFQVDHGDRRVTEVLLHVSVDQGRSYQQYATAKPTERSFDFEAQRDGWYYFIVQTVDEDNRRYPSDIRNEEAGLKVYVDTTTPQVRARASRSGRTVTVDWDLRDDNLDLATLRVEYREAGGNWQQRLIERRAVGRTTFDPGTNADLQVRVEVKDKAGNLGEDVAETRPGSGSGSDRRPAWEDDPPPSGGSLPYVSKVNSKNIRLGFETQDVGTSGISHIEIHMRRGATGKWEEYQTVRKSEPPCEVTVDKEGLYGFTLIAVSGVNRSLEAPRDNEEPQIWVEVDTTEPDVTLDKPQVGGTLSSGHLDITWVAKDKNLGTDPITLEYREETGSDWKEIPGAARLANTGRFRWQFGRDVTVPKIRIRLIATDEAKNVRKVETPEAVVLDLSKPKVRVIRVEPGAP